jgi:hypothetical protein
VAAYQNDSIEYDFNSKIRERLQETPPAGGSTASVPETIDDYLKWYHAFFGRKAE